MIAALLLPASAYASLMVCSGFQNWLNSNCQTQNGCYPSFQGSNGTATIPVNQPGGIQTTVIHFNNTSCGNTTCQYHVTETDYYQSTATTTFLYNMTCDCVNGGCHSN